jgi:Protein of unknown function (DUF3365)
MTITRTAMIVAALTATLAGQSEYKSWPLSQAPEELRPAISRADLVVVTMQSAVLRELDAALARGDAAGGVSFCHVDVTGIIQRVSREPGVAAGRTSDRLRNPANAPRPWAAALVAAHAGRPAKGVDGYAVDLGDKVGVLRPIAERPMCASCHGTGDRLAPGVALLLRDRYPSDRAIGFHDGEIRGWFWVELPKQSR